MKRRASVIRRRFKRRRVMKRSRSYKTTFGRRVYRSLRVMRKQAVLRVVKRNFVGTIAPGSASTSQFYNYVTFTMQSAGSIFGTPLTGMSNLNEFNNLFDRFRLGAVKYEFRPRVGPLMENQSIPTTATFREKPYITYLVEPTATTTATGSYAISTYNALAEQGRVRTIRGDRPFSIYVRPMITEQYGGGATRYIRPQFTNNDGTGQTMEHRGFYIMFHNQGFQPPNMSYDVYATYYVTFKGMK